MAMQGPNYLALAANDFMSCGRAHPDVEFVVLVYDVRTGAPVNWLRLMPKSLGASGPLDQAGDGTNIGLVASPVLTDLFTKSSVADGGQECLDVLQSMDLHFIIWPDAQADGIALYSPGIPHVEAPCAGPETIPMPVLRKLSFNGELLDAIATAHTVGWH